VRVLTSSESSLSSCLLSCLADPISLSSSSEHQLVLFESCVSVSVAVSLSSDFRLPLEEDGRNFGGDILPLPAEGFAGKERNGNGGGGGGSGRRKLSACAFRIFYRKITGLSSLSNFGPKLFDP
jgi:hypothetical protein